MANMVSTIFYILGLALGIAGWIGTIVTCALPMWRFTAFIVGNLVTAQKIFEGIWMFCVQHSMRPMQCKVYASAAVLPGDRQAARALSVLSIIVGVLAIVTAMASSNCADRMGVRGERCAKAKVRVASGVAFIVAGVLCLVPVCCMAHNIAQVSPIVGINMPQLGVSLYIGWVTSALLVLGGALLLLGSCCRWLKAKDTGSAAKNSVALLPGPATNNSPIVPGSLM